MYRVAPVFWDMLSGNKQPDRLPPDGRCAVSAVPGALDIIEASTGGGDTWGSISELILEM